MCAGCAPTSSLRSTAGESPSALQPPNDNERVGVAYGLEFLGAGLGAGLLDVGLDGYPGVRIEQRPGPMPAGGEELDQDHARLRLLDGFRWLTIDRVRRHAVYWGPPLTPDELVHPWLWPAASVVSRWHGREAFHGGALVTAGGAWALLGAKEAGKSTLLAAYAARGGAVLADDLVVTDGTKAFAGPRCIDLRAPLPASVPNAFLYGHSRSNTRRRVALAPLPAALPLAGWVFIGWGERLELRRVPGPEALARLARWRAWSTLRSDPSMMLTLAGLPAFELSRPRAWEALDPALDLLLKRVASL